MCKNGHIFTSGLTFDCRFEFSVTGFLEVNMCQLHHVLAIFRQFSTAHVQK